MAEVLPIQRKLMRVFMMTSSAVLAVACSIYFVYELFTFRRTMVMHLSMLGKVIASNSTASLAFYNEEDATEVLSAVTADKHILAAALYDEQGELFAWYPDALTPEDFPVYRNQAGYVFKDDLLVGFEPVVQGDRKLGTLFIRSDMLAIYERLTLYAIIAISVIALSLLLVYLLSRWLQRGISRPILQLAETAKSISGGRDYSVRATKVSNDEIGLLTDAFNLMLSRIDEQTQEITTFNQQLEERVLERTRELMAANKELEAFSYSVSHDLRAPLRSVHGYMTIFSEEYRERLDDEGKRLVSIILNNATRMGQLIDDLLSFSQLGRKDLRMSRVAMKALVDEVWKELSEMEAGRKINFVVRNIPPAIADSVTVKQVWTNLISNACKYTRNREEADIEIGSLFENKTVVYYIKDNGAGFEMKYYDKLFGVFQRLHSEQEFSGTGVGLAIVERIIAKHGGAIWAASKVNEGSTFFFTLTPGAHVPRPSL